MRASRLIGATLLGLAGVAAMAAPASAQSSGPLTLQPISSSIVFAPDVKVTTVDDKTAVLAGFYAGKQIERRVLVGGAFYWLADPRDDARMAYGGLVVGGRVLGDDRFNVTARALAGIGWGTVYRTYDLGGIVPMGHHGRPFPFDGTYRVGYRDDFALLEPEVRAAFKLTNAVSVNLGAGYRVTSADRWLNDAFRGATGSVGIQFELGR